MNPNVFEAAKELAYDILFRANIFVTADDEEWYARQVVSRYDPDKPLSEQVMAVIAADFDDEPA